MPKLQYKKITFKDADKIAAVANANDLIATYADAGDKLTLRQLYYRFVAGDLFPGTRKWSWTGSKWVRDANGTINAEPNYKWIGDVIADARMGGYMDWDAIEDRTREVSSVQHWETPADILGTVQRAFRVDKWTTQRTRLECWVEKDALEGLVTKAAHPEDVPVFSCRGYGSLSSMWESANRLRAHVENKQKVVILHLGDHDPSGVDMTRDLEKRLNRFVWRDLVRQAAERLADEERDADKLTGLVVDALCQEYELEEEDVWNKKIIEVRRIGLTMEQVETYNPPPNPAKQTDARYKKYKKLYGDECWELDALPPDALKQLVTDSIRAYREEGPYAARVAEEKEHRRKLAYAAEHWDGGLAEAVMAFKPKVKLISKQAFVPPKTKPKPKQKGRKR